MNLENQIQLPEPDFLPDISLNFLELIETSSPFGKASAKEVTSQDLSFLLWCAYGVKMLLDNGIKILNIPTLSKAPLFDIYVWARNIQGLDKGTYYFSPVTHSLFSVKAEESFDNEGFRKDDYNAGIIWAVFKPVENDNPLTQQALIDVGHSCQNLYLAAHALKLFCIPLVNLDSNMIDDKPDKIVVYGANIGRA